MRAKKSDLIFTEIDHSKSSWEVKYSEQIVAKVTLKELEYTVHFFYGTDTTVQKAIIVDSFNSTVDSILDWVRKPIYEIIHISDNHSTFPTLPPEIQVVVSSGDFLPNKTRGIREIEERFQTQWVIENIPKFKTWLGDRRFLFCSGNHDFIDPCPILRKEGINATNITLSKREHNGVSFYGFPYIPWIGGEWNYECHSNDMYLYVQKLKEVLLQGVDVLVAHCPPYGILDADFVIRDGPHSIVVPKWTEHCGNLHLTNLLSYQMDEIPEHLRPKYLLTGHMHQHYGWSEMFGITISQAATQVHTLEINL